MEPRAAKLVSPASSAKIVTASRIELSFLRVEIETREGKCHRLRPVRIVVIPKSLPVAGSSVRIIAEGPTVISFCLFGAGCIGAIHAEEYRASPGAHLRGPSMSTPLRPSSWQAA